MIEAALAALYATDGLARPVCKGRRVTCKIAGFCRKCNTLREFRKVSAGRRCQPHDIRFFPVRPRIRTPDRHRSRGRPCVAS